jgi:hypothetical protein
MAGVVQARAWEDSSRRCPLDYSPLALASRGRLPGFSRVGRCHVTEAAVPKHPTPLMAVPDLAWGQSRCTHDTRPALVCAEDGWGAEKPLFCRRSKGAVR